MSDQTKEEKLTEDRLKIKELELETQYKINALSNSFDTLRTFFEDFRSYVDNALSKTDDRIDAMSDKLKDFIYKEEERNSRIWSRLNVITLLVALQLFGVSVDVVDIASTVFLRLL